MISYQRPLKTLGVFALVSDGNLCVSAIFLIRFNLGEKLDELNGLYLKGSKFSRALKGSFIEAGSELECSIYGENFPDENFNLKHDEPFLLSMGNEGKPNTNNSKFMITTGPLPDFDGKHVVFGRVTKGRHIVRHIQNLIVDVKYRLYWDVNIISCGQIQPGKDDGYEKACFGDVYASFPEDLDEVPNHDEILDIAEKVKQFGNEKVKIGHYWQAIEKYEKSIRYVLYRQEERSKNIEMALKFHKIHLKCILNKVYCYVKNRKYDLAIEHASRVMEMPPIDTLTHVKALYRRAQAYAKENLHERAYKDLCEAIKMDKGKDSELRNFYLEIKDVIETREKDIKNNFSKIFPGAQN